MLPYHVIIRLHLSILLETNIAMLLRSHFAQHQKQHKFLGDPTQQMRDNSDLVFVSPI